MKTVKRWLKPIFCFAMLVLVASCGAKIYIPNINSMGNMSVKEARKVLATELPENAEVFVDGRSYHLTGVSVAPTTLIILNESGKNRVFKIGELDQITHTYAFGIPDKYTISLKNELIFITQCKVPYTANTNIPIALYVLKQNAIKAEKDADEEHARFSASIADYRKKAASNAAIPEEANRYKVQAEGAVRDKEFYDAADFYAEALKIVPWWSVGHFNRALVLGETGEYEEAIREMKHYLQLVPDAPNVRAAQDKIYDWERLEAK
ncbi:MAG: hypothetical protein HZB80_02190 [Deltaproteobacteria bacterium]|nr:hypothetical protein [Deltaproteobacteria bacterium]